MNGQERRATREACDAYQEYIVAGASEMAAMQAAVATYQQTVEREWSPISEAPKDQRVEIQFTFKGKAFWCEEMGRWLMTSERRVDFVPDHGVFRLPTPPGEKG